MQHAQYNFVIAALLMLAMPVLAGTVAKPHKPDPLLDGGPTAPCAAGTDYTAGTDANGKAVVAADVAARPVPVPDEISIPVGGSGAQAPAPTRRSRGRQAANPSADPRMLGGQGSYVSLDGRKLGPLLNPPPCR